MDSWDPRLKRVRIIGPSAGTLASIRRSIVSGIGSPTVAVRVIRNVITRTQGGDEFASGGIVNGPTRALVGEAGREAIVPLDRPLAQVDASVRALAAIAQGKRSNFASGGVVGGGGEVIVEEGAVQVVTGSTNPGVVGTLVLDGIANAIASARN